MQKLKIGNVAGIMSVTATEIKTGFGKYLGRLAHESIIKHR
jgi:hypothetical protein